MSDFRLSVAPEGWPLLDQENATEYLLHLGASPLADRAVSDELTWIMTGVDDNTYNGVVRTRLDQADADAAIATTVERFRSRDLPALWYLDQDSQPADLDRRLESHGCIALDAGYGMAADLTRLNDAARSIAGLKIERVGSDGALADWCSVYAPDDERRKALYASLGYADETPLRHFLGRLDGAPVAAASIFLARRAAGLYHVEVAPEVRRRGIGTAVVQAALDAARQAGYQMAVLGPTPEAVRLYEKLGFRSYRSTYRYFAI